MTRQNHEKGDFVMTSIRIERRTMDRLNELRAQGYLVAEMLRRFVNDGLDRMAAEKRRGG